MGGTKMKAAKARTTLKPNKILVLSEGTLQEIFDNYLSFIVTNIHQSISAKKKNTFNEVRKEKIFDLKQPYESKEIIVNKPLVDEVLQEVYRYIEIAEKKCKCAHKIKRKEHLYPFDVILLFNKSQISEKELKTMSSAATFFYMLSHLTDDYLDDPMKMHSKFITDDVELDMQEIFKIFKIAFKEFTKDNFSKSSAIKLQYVFQKKYFDMILTFGDMVKQFDSVKFEDRFAFSVHWKANKLSGLMYSFISDVFLHTINSTSWDEYNKLCKVTQALGYLCQLTDDMRDFEKDLQNNQINIFHSLLNVYSEEEKIMKKINDIFEEKINETQNVIKSLDIKLDIEKLVFVASYPFSKEEL